MRKNQQRRRRRGGGGIVTSLLGSLTGYWHLDEESGTRADVTGNTPLTSNNSVGFDVGKIGNAAAFVAASSRSLTANDNASLSVPGNTSFWFYAWFNPNELNNSRVVLSKGNLTSYTSSEYALDTNSAGTNLLRFWIGNGTTNTFVASSVAYSAAAWNLAFCWYNPSLQTINMQLNNGTVTSAAWAGGTQDTAGQFAIGKWASLSSGFFNGLIDEVAFGKGHIPSASERSNVWNGGDGMLIA